MSNRLFDLAIRLKARTVDKNTVEQNILTITSPLPPRAIPALKVSGALVISSRRRRLYSSSMVSAATPLPRVPVIRDTAPAAPPRKGKTQVRPSREINDTHRQYVQKDFSRPA